LAYVAHLLPYATVRRELFVVYYALPYLFALLALALSLDCGYGGHGGGGHEKSTSGGGGRDEGTTGPPQAAAATRQQGQWRLARRAGGNWRLTAVPLLGLASFAYLRPLVTGSLPPRPFLARLAAATPACHFNECFHAPPGTPLRAAVDRAGGDERAGAFPVILGDA
jgi:hypothetical protein